jgi:hypothetical protein
VIAAVQSRPDFDIFTGRSHVVWPEDVPVPEWAAHGLARGLAFSVVDMGESDREMGVNKTLNHPSGNHFWFRRDVLSSVPLFPTVEPIEPDFVMDAKFVIRARRLGHRGVFVPEVKCGHRIQPGLVDAGVLLERAERYGRARAHFDSILPPKSALRAWLRPFRWRGRRLAWRLRGHWARLRPAAAGLPAQAQARMQFGFYDQLLRRRKFGSTE